MATNVHLNSLMHFILVSGSCLSLGVNETLMNLWPHSGSLCLGALYPSYYRYLSLLTLRAKTLGLTTTWSSVTTVAPSTSPTTISCESIQVLSTLNLPPTCTETLNWFNFFSNFNATCKSFSNSNNFNFDANFSQQENTYIGLFQPKILASVPDHRCSILHSIEYLWSDKPHHSKCFAYTKREFGKAVINERSFRSFWFDKWLWFTCMYTVEPPMTYSPNSKKKTLVGPDRLSLCIK